MDLFGAAEVQFDLVAVIAGEPWSAAETLRLIAAHGAFLGTPTGLVAAIILRIQALRTRASRT